MQTKEFVEKVGRFCSEPLEKIGASLWDITFEKEGTRYVLTVFLDRDSGIGTEDCEVVSRHIDPLLDGREFDQLPPYLLTVSSAGLERHITTDVHLNWAIGKKVNVSFYKATNGVRTLCDTLDSFDKDTITIGNVAYNRKELAGIRLHFDF